MGKGVRWAGGSGAGERGLALLDEGGHPLAAVIRGEQAGEQLALPREAAIEVHLEAAVDGELGRPDGLGRAGRVLLDQGDRRVVHALAGRDDLVDEPDLERL